MSPEERDELMDFILQSQSDAAERNREMAERHREMMQDIERNSTQIEALAAATHDLVEVARMHSRRLDRLEGLGT